MTKRLPNTFKHKFTEQHTAQLTPEDHCHKCGVKPPWIIDVEPLSWRCVYCSNVVYFVAGNIEQQIDILLRNPIRRKEYVKRGNTIIPAPNDLVEILRLRRRLRMERAYKNVKHRNRPITD